MTGAMERHLDRNRDRLMIRYHEEMDAEMDRYFEAMKQDEVMNVPPM